MLAKKRRPPLLLVLAVFAALSLIYVSGALDGVLAGEPPTADGMRAWLAGLPGKTGAFFEGLPEKLGALAGRLGIDLPFLRSGNSQSLCVHVLSVGKADAILLVCANEAMLVDAGEAETAQDVIDYIRGLGITELRGVVATHPHKDHIGGMAQVIRAFNPKTCYASPRETDSPQYAEFIAALEENAVTVLYPRPGDTLTLGGADIEFLGPLRDDYADINDASLIFRLAYQGVSILFPADGGISAQQDMMDAGVNLKADILKIPHHGDGSSNKKAFLEAVAPRYAVLTQSDPADAQTALDRLADRGAKVYATSGGTVVFTVQNGRIRAEQKEEAKPEQ